MVADTDSKTALTEVLRGNLDLRVSFANAGLPEFVAPLSTFWCLKKNFLTRVNKSKLSVTVNRLIGAADEGVVKQTLADPSAYLLQFQTGPESTFHGSFSSG